MEMNVSEAKSSLRKTILQGRSNAKPSQSSRAIASNLLELCTRLNSKTVGVYLSFGSEPDSREFISLASSNGITLAAPRITSGNQMEFALLDGRTIKSQLGFDEPTGEMISSDLLDLIITPALAVSKTGIRLGRGAGYYDRYLENSRAEVAAVVYTTEVLEQVPSQAHDHKVDYIVTQDGILQCHS